MHLHLLVTEFSISCYKNHTSNNVLCHFGFKSIEIFQTKIHIPIHASRQLVSDSIQSVSHSINTYNTTMNEYDNLP